jgi:uncharacterized membrane protein YbhN (UPF0104 family)
MASEGNIVIEERQPGEDRGRNVIGPFALSFVLAGILIAMLVSTGGVWNVLANTRLLDLLIKGGVIAYHDDQIGFIEGVSSYEDYLKSQDPIDWPIIVAGVGIFFFFWLCKGFQFHILCRFYGIEGGYGQHVRSYYQGLFYNYFLPYKVGDVATIESLRGAGASGDRVAAVMQALDLFVIFEIVMFALVAIPGIGWGPWLAQLFWALVILAIAWLFVRAPRGEGRRLTLWKAAPVIFRELAKKPRTLIGLALLSLAAFGVEDIAAYCAAMAFTGDVVRLHVDFSVLLMGVVGSYIARFIPVTPGGIGQFEWGFAAALYIGGVGLPEAVTIGLLDNILRYAAYLQFYFIVINVPPRSGHLAPSSTIFGTFRRSRPEAA